MKFIAAVIILLPMLLSDVYGDTGSSINHVYTLARAPQRSQVKTVKDWEPFVEVLRAKTGANIRLKVYDSRDEFEHDLMQGSVDFVFANPGYFIVARQIHNYEPLIRSGKDQLAGIVVVRKSEPINSLQDLQNATIALPDKTAFAASLYIKSILDNLNISYEVTYVNGHDNVYRNVANGNFIAGGGVYRTLDGEPESLRNQLRVIYETPAMSPHPLFAHPRVPKTLQQQIIQTVLSMASDAQGVKILDNIKVRFPVKADYQADYAAIKPIALTMYKNLLSSTTKNR